MDAYILHSGFDGLKFTIQTDIPPALRAELASAKEHAKTTHSDCIIELGPIKLSVTNKGARGFTAHTGDHGAVWLFQDPEDRIPNNPGVTVDFRAFGLATGGLEGAEHHFRDCMAAFSIPYVETQLRVARADFAVDFLAPWFEPDREALIVPPKTKVEEIASVDEAATMASGLRVTGIRSGAVGNRQIAIYDKRAEVIQSKKLGWVTIWNAARKDSGHPPIDLTDRDASQVWRAKCGLDQNNSGTSLSCATGTTFAAASETPSQPPPDAFDTVSQHMTAIAHDGPYTASGGCLSPLSPMTSWSTVAGYCRVMSSVPTVPPKCASLMQCFAAYL